MEIRIAENIMKQYEIIEKVGEGANGIVWKVMHRQKLRLCAIKKCPDSFKNAAEAQRIFREIEILSQLQGCENIVSFRDLLLVESDVPNQIKDIYLVFEFLDADLDKIIRVGILEEVNKQYIIYQIIKAIWFMHSRGVIHRDLKPSNILSNKNCVIKIGDFGMARSYDADPDDPTANTNDNIMTDYVATRWYRAPEILLGSDNYGPKADVWAMGCILGEMILGRVAFQGSSTLNQIEKIVEVLGKPTKEDLDDIGSPMGHTIMHSINHKRTLKLQNYFFGANENSMDLLSKMLEFNPKKRISAAEALDHKYLETCQDEEDLARLREMAIDNRVIMGFDDNELSHPEEYCQRLIEFIYYKDLLKRRMDSREIISNIKVNINEFGKVETFKISPKKSEDIREARDADLGSDVTPQIESQDFENGNNENFRKKAKASDSSDDESSRDDKPRRTDRSASP
jgi:mitogen-activated protein kinase 15